MAPDSRAPLTHTDCPCGKRGYQSKRAAINANQSNNHTLRAYQCPRTRLWHVTKQVGSDHLREWQLALSANAKAARNRRGRRPPPPVTGIRKSAIERKAAE